MDSSVTLILFLMASGSAFSHSKHKEKSAFTKANHLLAMDIHRKLAAEHDGNVFELPFLFSTTLGMFYFGSQGRTGEKIRAALRYKNASLSHSQIHASFKKFIETIRKDSEVEEYDQDMHSAAFIQKCCPILQKYKDDLLKNYYTNAYDVDFQNERVKAIEEINDWVKLKTNNRIKEVLHDSDRSTRLLLLNAGNFNGTWERQFDPKHTSKKPFYNRGSLNEKKDVDMMRIVGEFRYERFGEGSLVLLPFSGENMFLFIYLPDTMKGGYEAEKKLTNHDAVEVMKLARKAKVELFLPKLKIHYEKILNPELYQLGFEKVFKNCDALRGTCKVLRLAIFNIVQKVFFEISENGIVFSGLTAVEAGTRGESCGKEKVARKVPKESEKECSVPSRVTRTEGKIIRMNCNHPFFTGYWDQRHGVYLEGRVGRV